MPQSENFPDYRVSILICLAIGGWLYFPVIHFEYIWDDLILRHDLDYYRVKDMLREAFLKPFLGDNYFRPIPVLTMIMESRWGGRELAASYGHAFNLTLFLFNVVLVILVTRLTLQIRNIAEPGWAMLFAGLVYTVHPAIMVGSALVYTRFDVMLASFMLSMLFLDLRLRHSGTLIRSIPATVLFLACALTKESALAIALVFPFWHLLVYDRAGGTLGDYFRWIRQQGHLAVYLAIFLGGCLYLLIRYAGLGYLLNYQDQATPFDDLTLWSHMLYVSKTLGTYLYILFFPFAAISPGYPSDYVLSPFDGLVVLGWVFLIGTIAMFAAGYKVGSWKWMPIIFILVMLPVLNIKRLDISDNIVALRMTILPTSLLVIMFAMALAKYLNTDFVSRIRYVSVIAVIWILAGVFTIYSTLPLWKNEYTFWSWYATTAPQSKIAYANYSAVLQRTGQYAQAIRYGSVSISRDPQLGPTSYVSTGISMLKTGKEMEGIVLLQKAMDFPVSIGLMARIQAHIAEGMIRLGKYSEAKKQLDLALQGDPDNVVAIIQLVHYYWILGDYSQVDALLMKLTAVTGADKNVVVQMLADAALPRLLVSRFKSAL